MTSDPSKLLALHEAKFPKSDEHDETPYVGQCCNFASRIIYGDCERCGRINPRGSKKLVAKLAWNLASTGIFKELDRLISAVKGISGQRSFICDCGLTEESFDALDEALSAVERCLGKGKKTKDSNNGSEEK